MTDELLDLVDQEDRIIDQMLRSEIYAKKLSNFRAVNLFLVNQEEQLWIPRRSAQKKLFASCLDASMGGHVSAGETYEQALERELMEELRINVAHVTCRQIGRLTPHEHVTSAFMKVYAINTDIIPNYNSDDYVGYYWLHPQEVLDRIAAGDPSKSDLPIMIKKLFF